MLYISGYINKCITGSLNIFLDCFQKINNFFDNNNINKDYKKHDFYNFKNLAELDEVVIYDKQPNIIKKSKSDPNLKINFKTNIEKEWYIY